MARLLAQKSSEFSLIKKLNYGAIYTTFRKIDHKCSTLIPVDEILEKLDLRVDICWISIDKIYINGYSSLYGLPRVPL